MRWVSLKHPAFDQRNSYISEILVHCVSGENRSACAVIAYLIYSKKMSFEEAYNEVKICLKMVFSNLSKV